MVCPLAEYWRKKKTGKVEFYLMDFRNFMQIQYFKSD